MTYNNRTQTFPQWMLTVKDIATDEYNFELSYEFDENEFWGYYEQGMDADEAIITHQEKA